MKLDPPTYEEEEGFSDFRFENLSAEAAAATPFYQDVLNLIEACEARLKEIDEDLEKRKSLVAASILGKLSGMQRFPISEQ